MRQYIIHQMHKRIMNEDETANLEYPEWKRRAVMIAGFAALRLWGVCTIVMIPFVIALGIVVYSFEAIQRIFKESFLYVVRDTIGANYRNLKADVRGFRNIWNGEYGKGRLLPERREMRVKNPAGKPTPLED